MPDRGCYIVTGGAGFIGSSLAAALVKQDPACDPIIIDDLRSGEYANIVGAFDRASLPPFAGRFIASPLDQLDVAGLVATRGLRAVFHFASMTGPSVSEADAARASLGGFEPILLSCVQAGMPLIYASSAAVYGLSAQRGPLPLSAAGRPLSACGVGKWLMECAHARMSGRTVLGTPHVVGLRFFDVFGPGEASLGEAASAVHHFASAMVQGRRPVLTGDGSSARDFVYIDDAVTATLAALGMGTSVRPRPGVYNVGSGVAMSMSQVLAVVRDELAITDAALAAEVRPAERHCGGADFVQADLAATTSGLGWKPSWNPIEAIRVYARWLKSAGSC
jgi:ADP-L-glycero-D-manno-heptose 6-epimerase